MSSKSTIIIDKLRFLVSLGCSEWEQKTKQPIEVTVKLSFKQTPDVCSNDSGTYICYHTICNAILNRAENSKFRLVEFMTMEFYDVIKKYLKTMNNEDIKIQIAVKKCEPPVDYNIGGMVFEYSD